MRGICEDSNRAAVGLRATQSLAYLIYSHKIQSIIRVQYAICNLEASEQVGSGFRSLPARRVR